MLAAVHTVKDELNSMSTTDYFACIYEKAKCTSAETAKDFYRLEFFKLVDAAIVQQTEKFRERKVVLKKYLALEDILLTGVVSPITEEYPELKPKALKIELSMFRHQNQFNSTTEAVIQMQLMKPEV